MGATTEARGVLDDGGRESFRRRHGRRTDAAAQVESSRRDAALPSGHRSTTGAARRDARSLARGVRPKPTRPLRAALPSRRKRTARDGDPARVQFVFDPTPSQLTRTFDDPALERDFIAFCQLSSPASWSASDAETLWLELLGQANDHVCLPEFHRPDAAREICGSTLLEPLQSQIEVDPWAQSRSIYATLCATRLLTVEEERSVLRRLHYFKHLAWRVLSQPTISQWDLTRADGLIKAATWHRDVVVQANMRLIVSIVKKLRIESHWYDELISDGTVALLRAVNKFDPGRGYRFCTFASTVIRRDCYRYIKNRQLDDNRYRKVATVPVLPTVGGKVAADSEPHIQADRAHWLAWRERLASMMSLLTRREQVIIRSRYCLGSHRRVKTLKRLSAALKISKERVRQIELGALAKLRAAAELEGSVW